MLISHVTERDDTFTGSHGERGVLRFRVLGEELAGLCSRSTSYLLCLLSTRSGRWDIRISLVGSYYLEAASRMLSIIAGTLTSLSSFISFIQSNTRYGNLDSTTLMTASTASWSLAITASASSQRM